MIAVTLWGIQWVLKARETASVVARQAADSTGSRTRCGQGVTL
jgi:hypothetical protein